LRIGIILERIINPEIYIVPSDYNPVDILKYTYEEAVKNMWNYHSVRNQQPPIVIKLEYYIKLPKLSQPGDHMLLHKSIGALNLKRESIEIQREAIPHPILRTIEKKKDFFMWADSNHGIEFVRKWKLWQ
jgi:hypothetical protein